MIYTASFYNQEHWVGQPYRVSRAHPRGRRTQWETLPFFYPSRDLLRSYRDGQIDFAQLSASYLEELDLRLEESPEMREWLEVAPRLGDFTLLCFERAGQPCHRRVLARWLLRQEPMLELGELQ